MYKYRVAVNNQLCYKYSRSDRLVSDGINFTNIVFMFYEGWDGLDCVAQFRQGEECYSVALVNNECKLPNELVAGNVSISVFGYKAGEAVRGTTVSLNDQIYDSGFDGNADPVPPTPDLYSQLLAQIKRTEADTSGYAESAKQSANEAKDSQKAAANSAEEAEASANKSAESAEEAERAKNEAAAEMGKVQDAGEAAVSEISQAKTKAVQDVQQAGTEAVDAVGQAKTQVLSDMQGLGNTLVGSIDKAGEDALDGIAASKDQSLQDIKASKTSALEEVNRAGTAQVGAVNTAGQAQQMAIQQVGKTATQQVQQTGVEQSNKVTQAGDDKLAEIKAANAILPTPTQADAGKAIIVKPDGSGYELAKVQVDAYTKAESDARYAPIEAAIRPTVSGNPATLEHSVAWAMQGLSMYGKSTQATTTGAQLFDSKAALRDTWIIVNSGETEIAKGYWTSDYIPVREGPYWLSYKGSSRTAVYDAEKTFVRYLFFTGGLLNINNGEAYIRFSGNTNNPPETIMFNAGSTALPWEPYTGGIPSPFLTTAGSDGSIDITVSDGADQTQQLVISTPNGLPGIPVDSGGNYTDADGQQWVCDEVDFARAVCVQRVSTHLIRNVSTISNARQQNPDYFGCTNDLGPDGIGYFSKKLMSDKLVFVGNDKNIDGSEVTIVSGNGILVFGLKKSVVSEETVEAVTHYLSENPITILYVLKEPIEIPLNAEELAAYTALRTYDGTTVVATDAPVAGLSARYVADGAAYIDSKIQAAIAEAVTQAVALTGGNA